MHHQYWGTRRHLLKLGSLASIWGVAGALGWQGQSVRAEAEVDPRSRSPQAALDALMSGNQRFCEHHPQYPDQSVARLQAVAQGQHPFATVLTCADSRVPVELIFDQGIGDIFDVRIAGNIATPEAIGSIEYAVVALGTPLLMVLGHERCGAVTATVQGQVLAGEMNTFVAAIQPAWDRVKDQPGDAVENGVIANVQYQIQTLQRSPLLKERLNAGTLQILGACYDLDTGRVNILT